MHRSVDWRRTDEGPRPFLPDSSTPVIWAPQPGGQAAFLQLAGRVFEVVGEGNRGGGKTSALFMDFCQDVGRGFGAAWRGMIVRKEYGELDEIIAQTHEVIPRAWPHARFVASKPCAWVWPDGERLEFRAMRRPEDYGKVHGQQIPWWGWEELTQYPDLRLYLKCQSCVRSKIPEVAARARVRGNTNPSGVGHNVVKSRFELPMPPGQIVGRIIADDRDDAGRTLPSRCAVHIDRGENRVLMEASPEYETTIASSSASEMQKRAWLHGDWDIVAGGMFDDLWNRSVHIVEPFAVPHTWTIERVFDWGSSAPFAVLWCAMSDGCDVQTADGDTRATVRGDVYIVAEWYGWNGRPNEGLRMLASDISRGIIERERRWGLYGRVRTGVADSAIYTVENGMCIADDMAEPVRVDGEQLPGIQWIASDKSPGSRKNGWQLLRRYLADAVPKDGARERGGLFVFSSCTQVLRCLPVTPRDEKDPDDVDTDAEDHIVDAIRYHLRSLYTGSTEGRTTGMW